MLTQCPALAHLDICSNQIGPVGAESLAGVLGQCVEMAHLDLYTNDIGDAGIASIAGVLSQCQSLVFLDLIDYKMLPVCLFLFDQHLNRRWCVLTS